ncbi:MAG: tRNA (adenosine(37)-N6)-threonylcarbamoyltransferase complex ATPase subunit type 1 TsaE [Rugosibacter sp.]
MHDAAHLTVATTLPDEAATLAFAARLAYSQCLAPGLVIWLEGDLGAGKTTLVRGLLRALGETGPVKSPTYTLLEVHVVSGLHLYHFDFYRLNQPEEYLDAGLDDYFSGSGVCLVEWPGKAAPYLPPADLLIELRVTDKPGSADGRQREIICHASSLRGRACLTAATSSSSPPPA